MRGMLQKNRETEAAFIEEMGVLSQADDLPRIAGRIVGLLVLEEKPASFGRIAEKLGVSRASVSTNTRLLVEAGLVERVAMPGDRQDYYRLAADSHLRMLRRIVGRMERLNAALGAVETSLPPEKAEVKRRLCEFGRFHLATIACLNDLAAATVDRINSLISGSERTS